jgi:hypothetical protein
VGEVSRAKAKEKVRQNTEKQRRFRESMKVDGAKQVLLWDYPLPPDYWYIPFPPTITLTIL